MLTEYLDAAMRAARYEIMEDGRFFGEISKCRGTLGEGDTLEKCRQDLRGSLEGWVIGGFRSGHRLPVIEGIDMNPPRSRRKAPELAHA